MDAYRAIVDKRDQRAFLPRPIPEDVLRRILRFGVGSCPAHPPEAELGALLGVPDGLHVNRVLGFGYIDPGRTAPPRSVARRRRPLEELTHWEGWRT